MNMYELSQKNHDDQIFLIIFSLLMQTTLGASQRKQKTIMSRRSWIMLTVD